MTKRIESKTSRTAEMTCFSRAASYLEDSEQYKSDDYISLVMVPSFIKPLIKWPIIRRRFLKWFGSEGIYEYVIARTKFIDYEFKNALEEGYEQILIFGAGFDSRAVRFANISKNVRIFEMDVPVTQNDKIDCYRKKGIVIPGNLVFIPIDFEKQRITERLSESGFAMNKKSLFILEGLTMYLQSESVDQTFKIIQEYAGQGSKIVFDYIYASVLRNEKLYYGEPGMLRRTAKVNEAWVFGIEKGSIDEFLTKYGFEILSHMNSSDLESMFFRDKQGNNIANVNGTHCIVTAIKMGCPKNLV
jgi:methyltransferase (TIGR00027 family)